MVKYAEITPTLRLKQVGRIKSRFHAENRVLTQESGFKRVLKGVILTKLEQEAVDWGIAQYQGRKVGSKDNCNKMKVLVAMAIKSDSIVYNIHDKQAVKDEYMRV